MNSDVKETRRKENDQALTYDQIEAALEEVVHGGKNLLLKESFDEYAAEREWDTTQKLSWLNEFFVDQGQSMFDVLFWYIERTKQTSNLKRWLNAYFGDGKYGKRDDDMDRNLVSFDGGECCIFLCDDHDSVVAMPCQEGHELFIALMDCLDNGQAVIRGAWEVSPCKDQGEKSTFALLHGGKTRYEIDRFMADTLVEYYLEGLEYNLAGLTEAELDVVETLSGRDFEEQRQKMKAAKETN